MEPVLFTTHQWLVLLGAVLSGAIAVVLWTFGMFVTRREYEREINGITERMVRIEMKLDRLLENRRDA